VEGLSKFFANFSTWFSELNSSRKVLVLAGLGLFLSGLIVMSLWTQKQELQVLFSNMAAEDSSAIIEDLKGRHIPYELKQSGRTILVPSDQVHELRLKFASQGLPRGGGIGFEIFDKPSLGMTEFVQNLNFRRGLEGELVRTITQLDEIDSARVHIAIPKKSLFMEKEDKPTASVVLKIKSSRRLKGSQVEGIGHLVASSVEGLSPEDVTIIDMHGNILSNGRDENGLLSLSRTQIGYQREIEKNLQKRAKSMLESILGPGKAIVRVSATINFEQVEKKEELFDPDSQVARSEQKTEESHVGSAIPTGIPGTVSNVPGATGAKSNKPPAITPPSSTKTRETINYELNKTVKKIVQQVGNIKKLSIAVIVDGTYSEEGKGAKKQKKYNPRSEEEMKRLRTIVERAVGFDAKRGDSIEVANAPFNTAIQEEATKDLAEASKKELWYNMGRYGVTAVFIILLFLMVFKPLVSWLSSIGKDLAALSPAPIMEAMEEGAGEGKPSLELAPIPESMEYRRMVSEYAAQDPQHTAELLRKWLKEKR